jgi:hypothetical protein
LLWPTQSLDSRLERGLKPSRGTKIIPNFH